MYSLHKVKELDRWSRNGGRSYLISFNGAIYNFETDRIYTIVVDGRGDRYNISVRDGRGHREIGKGHIEGAKVIMDYLKPLPKYKDILKEIDAQIYVEQDIKHFIENVLI